MDKKQYKKLSVKVSSGYTPIYESGKPVLLENEVLRPLGKTKADKIYVGFRREPARGNTWLSDYRMIFLGKPGGINLLAGALVKWRDSYWFNIDLEQGKYGKYWAYPAHSRTEFKPRMIGKGFNLSVTGYNADGGKKRLATGAGISIKKFSDSSISEVARDVENRVRVAQDNPLRLTDIVDYLLQEKVIA